MLASFACIKIDYFLCRVTETMDAFGTIARYIMYCGGSKNPQLHWPEIFYHVFANPPISYSKRAICSNIHGTWVLEFFIHHYRILSMLSYTNHVRRNFCTQCSASIKPGPVVVKKTMSSCSIWQGLWATAQERRCLCVNKRESPL